jgi:methionyl-tRNA formyltransferase
LVSSPVKRAAIELGIPVIEARKLDAGVREAVCAFTPDILVVVAFGRIFGKKFLDLFPLGGVNLHPSLLPRHRGPSPVTAAILGGDAETGVSIQRIALAVDSGAILAQEKVALTGTETAGSLSKRLGGLGAAMLRDVLEGIGPGKITETAQNEAEVSYCRLVGKNDGLLDWKEPAALIERKVRAFDPWPRAFTSWKGLALLVLKSEEYPGTLGAALEPAGKVLGTDPRHGLLVKTGSGVLAIERLQLQNKRPLDWRDFVNGNRGVIGSEFGG